VSKTFSTKGFSAFITLTNNAFEYVFKSWGQRFYIYEQSYRLTTNDTGRWTPG